MNVVAPRNNLLPINMFLQPLDIHVLECIYKIRMNSRSLILLSSFDIERSRTTNNFLLAKESWSSHPTTLKTLNFQ